jgi:Predicted nucleic acid-binding protein, contains PIN domain
MAKTYMLDTDICSYIIRSSPQSVIQKLWEHRHDDIRISAITRAELLHGARRRNSEKLTRQVQAFTERWETVAFDALAADAYAEIFTDLEERGTLIGNLDIQIAACARAAGAILVTNNQRHFSQVPGLTIENWI